MLPASVIVVSRHRADALARCITALRQQDHPTIEIVVVADPAACARLAPQTDLKLIPFDTPNISAARNLGLNHAAGEVALFIDDDAVAEPNWASLLTAAFENAAVVAATGFVRGRNGISYQWRACEVDHLGADHPLNVPQTPSLHQGTAQRAIKTQGTNCAFRASALAQIGGFDAAFAFYLDEADVNLRLAAHGQTAIVPDAQVHHGYMASARRHASRAPTDLSDIGASTALFLRKHGQCADMAAALMGLRAAQSARIARFIRQGKLSAHDGAQVLRSLEKGWAAGLAAPFGRYKSAETPPAFLPLQQDFLYESVDISGYFWQASTLHSKAAAARRTGKIVTVYCFSPTPRRHKMQFLPQGYWWQSGGIWGRSDRDKPASLWAGLKSKVAQERARIAKFRPNAAKNAQIPDK